MIIKSQDSGGFIFKKTTMMFLFLYFILGVGITYAYFAYQIQKDNVIVGNIVLIDADLEVDLMVGETTNLVPMMGALYLMQLMV